MNIKSITTLGLVAVAVAVTSSAPAEARNNNNDKALNQLAMQYYAQNQALAANSNIYNPLLTGSAIYNPALTANYGYANPYSYQNAALPYTAATNYGCNSSYNNNAYNSILAPQYTRLSQEAARIRARLATGNLPIWEANRLQNKLAKIQLQENSLASNGYGSPYGGGVFNNLRARLGI